MFGIKLNYNDVINLWSIADIVYEEPDLKHELFLNTDIVAGVPMQNNLDYCLALEYEDLLIFAFRGTDTKDNINEKEYIKLIKRWTSNLTAFPLVQNGPWGKGIFHHDMYNIFLNFKKQISYIIKNLDPEKQIITTGHSRGGPPAVYLHRHLIKNLNMRNTICLTFGCPRHMTREGVVESRELDLKVFNFINGYDIVTRIPKSLYRNEYDIYLKKSRLNIFNFWFRWISSGIKNHLQSGYDKTIHKRYLNYSNRIFHTYDNFTGKKTIENIK